MIKRRNQNSISNYNRSELGATLFEIASIFHVHFFFNKIRIFRKCEQLYLKNVLKSDWLFCLVLHLEKNTNQTVVIINYCKMDLSPMKL